ncbi:MULTISPECIES: YdcF family protein [Rhodopirellula]|uniref:YdcF family protein n=1 Tax=Rhodopirellula TaxID=265488 RepID=UPI0030EF5511
MMVGMNSSSSHAANADEPVHSSIGSRTSWSDVVVSLIVPAALVLLLVVVTWMQQGFVAGMRCGTDLIQPVGLVWLGMLALTVFAVRQWRRGTQSAAKALGWFACFILWWIVGNGDFANWMSGRVESPLQTEPSPALEQRDLDRPFDAVVVLGGGSSAIAPGFYELGRDGERVISAAQAYHAGATRKIIVTGSSTDGYEPPWKQSTQLLMSLGVPEDVIVRIEGVNTQAEMRSLKQLMDSPSSEMNELRQGNGDSPEELKVGLITSAFHMPRAMRLAKASSLELIPLPCAFRASSNERPWIASSLVPGAGNLETVAKMIKETIAKMAGQ